MVKVIVVLVIVVKRVFSLAKTIVVDVIVIYIPRIPVVFFVMGIWNKYPCRFIKHNIIIKVKKKNIYIYIRQEIQLTNKKKHIIQLFTKRNIQICNA